MKYKAIVYPDQWQDQFPMILKLGVPIGKTWKLVRNADFWNTAPDLPTDPLNHKLWLNPASCGLTSLSAIRRFTQGWGPLL